MFDENLLIKGTYDFIDAMTHLFFKKLYIPLLSLTFIMLPSFGHASGGVHCVSENKQVEIYIGLGRVPIYTPLNAYAKYGDKVWSSDPQDGETQLGDSQGMLESDNLFVDFADEQVMEIIISLRIDGTDQEDSDYGSKGILTFEDGVPHEVHCLLE